MENETLQQEEIAKIFKPVKKLAARPTWLSKKTRPVSKQGPIAIPVKGSTAAKQKAAAKAEAEAAKKPARRSAAKATASKAAAKPATSKPRSPRKPKSD
jgi:cell division protease FtsH